MSQIRLSEVLPGKALQWPEFFVRNIPNTRLESRVIPSTQCFEYLYYHTKHGDILFITGGEKDVLSLAAHGFNAISMNSETANIPKNLLRALSVSTTQVLTAIQVDSRKDVDRIVKIALENGGTRYRESADHGWMYYDTFADLDGHQWEVMFTDETQLPQ
jgi:hypothetical protein